MKRILALIVSVVILGGLLRAVDWADVRGHLVELQFGWFAAAIGLFAVQVVVSAVRWQQIARGHRLHLVESIGHVLASSALNLAVPAKLGDLSKAAFLTRRGGRGKAQRASVVHKKDKRERSAVSTAGLVVLEKLLDVAVLGGLLLLGLALASPRLALYGTIAGLLAVGAVLGVLGRRRRNGTAFVQQDAVESSPLAASGSERPTTARWRSRLGTAWLAVPFTSRCPTIVALSAALWCLHLLQIAFFFLAAGIAVTPTQVLSRVPLALFAGLLPFTVAGIGTRDSALVVLFLDTAPPAAVAVVGMLTALRYLIPGVAGLPVLAMYLTRQGRTSRPCHPGQAVSVPEPHVAIPVRTRSDLFA